jgi:hypothetical protein
VKCYHCIAGRCQEKDDFQRLPDIAVDINDLLDSNDEAGERNCC